MVEVCAAMISKMNGRNVTDMLKGTYTVDTALLAKDLGAISDAMKQYDIDNDSRRELKLVENTLGNLAKNQNITINWGCKEGSGEFVCDYPDIDCTGIQKIKKYNELTEIKKIEAKTDEMTVKYLLKDRGLVIVDLSCVMDAIAFDYAQKDESISVDEINAYTKDAKIYQVNNGSIMTDMISDIAETKVEGAYSHLIRQYRVNPMCPKVTFNGRHIKTYLNEDIPLLIGRRNKYKEVLDRSATEVTSCVIVNLANNANICSRVKVLGISNNCEIALACTNVDTELLSELSRACKVVARSIMKSFVFEPRFYFYHKQVDLFAKLVAKKKN